MRETRCEFLKTREERYGKKPRLGETGMKVVESDREAEKANFEGGRPPLVFLLELFSVVPSVASFALFSLSLSHQIEGKDALAITVPLLP